MRESLTMIGLLFLIYLASMLIIAFTLSGTIDDILVAIMGIDNDAVVDQVNLYIPVYRNALIVVFALGVASPFGYLIARIFSRDDDYYYYRGRY